MFLCTLTLDLYLYGYMQVLSDCGTNLLGGAVFLLFLCKVRDSALYQPNHTGIVGNAHKYFLIY